MLRIVNYIGRGVLSLLLGSWIETHGPRARAYTLAAGSTAVGLALGFILHLAGKLDVHSAYGGIPAAAVILTYGVESIKKEILKRTGPAPN